MRLPLRSWKETLGALGLRWAQKPRSRKSRRRERRLSFETLEQRQMLSGTPPQVTDLNVSSTAWTTPFVNYLASNSLGTGGYSIPDGSASQLLPLTWNNLDQIKVTFSENVDVDQSDLTLTGVSVSQYQFSNFTYDSLTFVATWTLASPLAADKLLVDLGGDGLDPIVDLDDGYVLDGEWTNSSDTYASGNGTQGGDFEFRFDVLPGDATLNGTVTALDYGYVYNQRNLNTTSGSYIPFRDINGSGAIDSTDYSFVLGEIGESLPAGNPAGVSNDAPTSAGFTNVLVPQDAEPTQLDLFAAFADTENSDSQLTYTVVGNSNPSLFSSVAIDGVEGTLTLSYAAATSGEAHLTLRATDTSGLYCETSFHVSVNDPPVATGGRHVLLVKDGDPLSLNLADWFQDRQDAAENLTFTVQSNSAPTVVGASISDGMLELTPGSTLGSSTITLRATDPGSLYGEVTITVGVFEPDTDLESTGGGPLMSLPWSLIDDENTGTLVSDLIAGLVNTSNPTGLGMAIYGVNSSLGSVEYSLDGGETWEEVGAVSPTAALLLAANEDTRVRFLPAAGPTAGMPSSAILSAATSIINFAGWNGAVGTAGQTLDLTHASNQAAVAPTPNEVRVQQTMGNLEFVVNTTTTGEQRWPRVAMAPDGRSVAVWEGSGQFGWGVYGQRFNSDGTRLGGEILIRQDTPGQGPPINYYDDFPYLVFDVTIDSGETFVVLTGKEGESSTDGVAQRFNFETGAAVGSAIQYATTSPRVTNAPYFLDADMYGR